MAFKNNYNKNKILKKRKKAMKSILTTIKQVTLIKIALFYINN